MKMIVVTKITSTFDLDSLGSTHAVEIEDQDGLSEVSSDVFMTTVMAGLRASTKAVREQAPRAGVAADRADEKEIARLREMLTTLGFCPDHGEGMPCVNGCSMG